MPAPKRSLRASNEVWTKIGRIADRMHMSRSQLLREAALQSLEQSALPVVRHNLNECLLTLVKIRELLQPYSIDERGQVADHHHLDEIVRHLHVVARLLHDGPIEVTEEDLPEGFGRHVKQIRFLRHAAEENARMFSRHPNLPRPD